MSRIGRKPITIPTGVSIDLQGRHLSVTGQKGTLELDIMSGIKLVQEGDQLIVSKTTETPDTQKSYGLMRTMVANMIIGVSVGFERKLEINGVGYRAAVSGTKMTLLLGFSHPVIVLLPEGITAKVEQNIITISGFDKQAVGQVAANIRAFKKPEPYKGKGIKYIEERIRRKAGKTAAKG